MRRSLLALLLLPGLAAAQTPPPAPPAAANQPIRLIVPFQPGGSSDAAARLIAPRLATALGRQVLVENRPGAGGTQGALQIAQSPPDGSTLGISNTTPHGIAPLAQDGPTYNADRDFTHIALIAETPSVLVVRADSRFRSFEEYMRAASTWTRGLTYGSSGIGTLQHLQGEMLTQASSARLTHVPYRGPVPALRDLLSGAIDSALVPLAAAQTKLQSGDLRVLAVSSPGAFAALPGVPTFATLGYPALTATAWTGLSGPRGLPPGLVARINAEVSRILADPEVAKQMAGMGLFPPAQPMSAAGYQALVAQFGIAWGPVVKASGIRAER